MGLARRCRCKPTTQLEHVDSLGHVLDTRRIFDSPRHIIGVHRLALQTVIFPGGVKEGPLDGEDPAELAGGADRDAIDAPVVGNFCHLGKALVENVANVEAQIEPHTCRAGASDTLSQYSS